VLATPLPPLRRQIIIVAMGEAVSMPWTFVVSLAVLVVANTTSWAFAERARKHEGSAAAV
jgi:hypothetical protein